MLRPYLQPGVEPWIPSILNQGCGTLIAVAQAGKPLGWPVYDVPEFQPFLGYHQSLELFDDG
ncbi:hypothetical protein DAQ1742_00529 [Dickeya aquatica]|uniref:Uncharacterized protein n=1 Tax=Dickeya aquatica TaxID=1401087 RepID=A0A375A6G7_9GAMM|nr:hypothetical protein DAQ1742_00529 [Dickeya aquatica]